MSRLLIAGAGYVGQALAEKALAAGTHEVSVLRRSPVQWPGVKSIQADLLQPESLTVLRDVGDIVYCAAADAADDASYKKIYQDGLRHLVEAVAKQGGYRRLIYVSSTSVYAESKGGWVDETNQNLAQAGSSRFMVSGEKWLMEGRGDYSILRMGGIYGPGRTWFLRRVKEGVERIYAQGGIYSNRIHRDDCVGMILHVLQSEAQRQVYNGVDCEAADRNEVIRWMAQQLGMDPATLQSTEDRTQIPARGNKRISNRKILDAGYRFLYPTYREGYTALLHEV
ncbi:SDR family oxidoreductase [Oligoflexus tunisiensis]|uniref:SDR family oxidoreductase n=1 Tax=Oligoflexus tunisiensis TaxID=708132 RepID=UPI000B30F116|nr:SDR family oxidoreductase [Oligoflexus tunisiensis]